MPIGLALEVGDLLDRRILHHGPIDREPAGLFVDVLRHDVGLQIAADHAVRQRQRRLRRAIQRARRQRLRHRRRALELGPFDIVGLAEIGEFRRPLHHPVFSTLQPGWSSRRGWFAARERRRCCQARMRQLQPPSAISNSAASCTPPRMTAKHRPSQATSSHKPFMLQTAGQAIPRVTPAPSAPPCPHISPGRPVAARSATAGCTWRCGRSAPASRS